MKKIARFQKTLMVFILLLFCLVGVSQATKPDGEVEVVGEQGNEVIVKVESAYIMGDNDTRIDAQNIALELGKGRAVEAVGSYVESTLDMTNTMITKEQANSISAALMRTEIVDKRFDITPDGLTKITITILAKLDKKSFTDKIKAIEGDKARREQLSTLYKENEELKTELTRINRYLAVKKADKAVDAANKAEPEALLTKPQLLEKRRGVMDKLSNYQEGAIKVFAAGTLYLEAVSNVKAGDAEEKRKIAEQRQVFQDSFEFCRYYTEEGMKVKVVGKPIIKKTERYGEEYYTVTVKVAWEPDDLKEFKKRFYDILNRTAYAYNIKDPKWHESIFLLTPEKKTGLSWGGYELKEDNTLADWNYLDKEKQEKVIADPPTTITWGTVMVSPGYPHEDDYYGYPIDVMLKIMSGCRNLPNGGWEDLIKTAPAYYFGFNRRKIDVYAGERKESIDLSNSYHLHKCRSADMEKKSSCSGIDFDFKESRYGYPERKFDRYPEGKLDLVLKTTFYNSTPIIINNLTLYGGEKAVDIRMTPEQLKAATVVKAGVSKSGDFFTTDMIDRLYEKIIENCRQKNPECSFDMSKERIRRAKVVKEQEAEREKEKLRRPIPGIRPGETLKEFQKRFDDEMNRINPRWRFGA